MACSIGPMPDPNTPSPSISLDQSIVLASRVFAAFLLFWVVEDITELPREIFSLMHYALLGPSYLRSEYVMYLLGNILRIALWLLAAGWFYRCGPRIRKFFATV